MNELDKNIWSKDDNVQNRETRWLEFSSIKERRGSRWGKNGRGTWQLAYFRSHIFLWHGQVPNNGDHFTVLVQDVFSLHDTLRNKPHSPASIPTKVIIVHKSEIGLLFITAWVYWSWLHYSIGRIPMKECYHELRKWHNYTVARERIWSTQLLQITSTMLDVMKRLTSRLG